MAQKLFDKASLVMIPSQYKEGKIYNIKPEDQSSAFDFERNTGATRVNSQGLIEKERSNLLLQSNNFDTTWETYDINTPTNGFSGYDGSSDAWLIQENAANANHWIRQSSSITSGIGTFSFYAKKKDYDFIQFVRSGDGSEFANFNINNGTIGNYSGSLIDVNIESKGNGWYRCSVTYSFNTNAFVGIALIRSDVSSRYDTYLGNGTNGTYIQDAQLEQGLVATDYIETTTSAVYTGITDNLPRLDYSSTEPALLLEPQRSNLVSNSEYFDTFWSTSSGGTRIHNQIISPEGIQNGTKMYPTSTGSFRGLSKAFGSTLSNTSYALSIFAKAGEFEHLFFYNIGSPDGNNGVWFNLTTGSVGTNQSAWSSAKMEDFGNGWYRCSAVITVGGSSDNLYILLADSNSSVTATKNGTDGLYLYGAQLEEGSYATSYIPTNGLAETRLADVCQGGGDVSVFNDSEGTLYYEFSAFEDTINRTIVFEDENGDNNIFVRIGGNGFLYFFVHVGGTQIVNTNWSGLEQTDNNKIAVRYSSSGYSVYVNGIERLTGTNSISFTNNINEIKMPVFPSNFKMVNYFPEALTDTELQQLTNNT